MAELNREELKTIQLDVLKTVAQYCEEHQLEYFLAYGTLLGAVRHKGYIPWDDDIDIVVPREDYEKFIKSFDYSDYTVHSHLLDETYPYQYAKVSKKQTRLVEKTDLPVKNLGVNIDIFPLDGIPDSTLEQERLLKGIASKNSLLLFKRISLDQNRKLHRNAALALGKLLTKPVSYKRLIKQIDDSGKANRYHESNLVSYVLEGVSFCGIPVDKSVYSGYEMIEFEGHLFRSPLNYDVCLRSMYGDYMTPPPVEEQVTHHNFVAYNIG